MTERQANSKAAPTHKLYRVVKGRTPQDKSIWTEVAACWPHKDGQGWNVRFKFNEAPTAGGEYVMRRDRRRDAQADA